MTDSLPQPCARWADFLAAHPASLSAAERRALDAHVASCQACAAVRADYQHMDAHIRSLPDPQARPGVPRWLQEAQAAGQPYARVPHPITPLSDLENHHMNIREDPGALVPTPGPVNQGRARQRRVASWITAAAAVVVITMITTALLVSHAGPPTNTGTQRPTSTPTAASSQGWYPVAGLEHLPIQPVIAPSNPKVIYLLGSNSASLKRSDDTGGHWKTLPLPPNAAQAGMSSLTVSANNPQNIFLLLTFTQPSAACSSVQASNGQINAYSGNSCTISYYSTDGGTHWGLMRCLTCGQAVGAGSLVVAGQIMAQGNHLYALIFDQNQIRRLITSSDDGAIWKYVDGTLLAQGLGVCGFAATPAGTSVYALVQKGYCSQPVGAPVQTQAQSGLSVWRTDDAGAHWAQVGAFSYQEPDTQAFRAVDTGGAQPTLFAAAGQGDTYARLMSLDGGKTWQPLPTEGIPASTFSITLPETALSDGSVLSLVQQTPGGSPSIYAWKPGSQAWHEVTPPLIGDPIEVVVSHAANGQDVFWVTTATSKGDFSIITYMLK